MLLLLSAGLDTLSVFFIVGCIIAGFIFSYLDWKATASIDISVGSLNAPAAQRQARGGASDKHVPLVDDDSPIVSDDEQHRRPLNSKSSRSSRAEVDLEDGEELHVMSVEEIGEAIQEGAHNFLAVEYKYMGGFLLVFGFILLIALGAEGSSGSWKRAVLTLVAFLAGAITSAVCGGIGMKIAVLANTRTAVLAQDSLGAGFNTAFRAAAVMGLCLVSLGLGMLFLVVVIFQGFFSNSFDSMSDTQDLFESVAGFGLGGSCVALFGRVGGGIYTKAADVGADLCGKLEFDIPEDDPRNPAVIADNVGDNVGDVAGMGADLFGSFGESSCAAMVLCSEAPGLFDSFAAITYPLVISASGIVVAILCGYIAMNMTSVRRNEDVEKALKRQILYSTLIMTPIAFILPAVFLPANFKVGDKVHECHSMYAAVAHLCGLWSGLVIGYFTEYFTSYSYAPVKEVAESCHTGAATNIIYGLALGYKSTIIPAFAMFVTIYVSHSLLGMLGIALAALGILSTMATGLTIDSFGPISDNAGGIAEMSQMHVDVRERTDALDAAGNTTAAIGKGFAIGSAAFVSLSLFGAFVVTVDLGSVNLLEPLQFGGLLLGAMLPYWFSAMTMKSVGAAALEMVKEVRRQFSEYPGILRGTEKPHYGECVSISTNASIREMIAPAALVIFSPLFVGFLLGVEALAGLLAGALVSGVQMAISASNTGGAWDNAKKYIEAGNFGGKGSPEHHAAVIGDTVGDPLKDTSGPSLNILIKLMAIISLVFGPSFPNRGYLVDIWE